MLCTDGLSESCVMGRSLQLLSRSDRRARSPAPVEAAIERGAPDNVTCVVADVAGRRPAGGKTGGGGCGRRTRTRSQLPGVDFHRTVSPSTPPNPPRGRKNPHAVAPDAGAAGSQRLWLPCWSWPARRRVVVDRRPVLRGQQRRLRRGSTRVPFRTWAPSRCPAWSRPPPYLACSCRSTHRTGQRDHRRSEQDGRGPDRRHPDEQAATCCSKPKTEGCPRRNREPHPESGAVETPMRPRCVELGLLIRMGDRQCLLRHRRPRDPGHAAGELPGAAARQWCGPADSYFVVVRRLAPHADPVLFPVAAMEHARTGDDPLARRRRPTARRGHR